MEELIIKYDVDDYIQANKLHYKNRPYAKYLDIIFYVVFFLSVFLVVNSPDKVLSWLLLIYFGLSATYSYLLLPVYARYIYNKHKLLNQETKIIVSKDQIIEVTAEQEIKLNTIHRLLFSDKVLLIYITPKTFIIIPKRSCKDIDQFDSLVGLSKQLIK